MFGKGGAWLCTFSIGNSSLAFWFTCNKIFTSCSGPYISSPPLLLHLYSTLIIFLCPKEPRSFPSQVLLPPHQKGSFNIPTLASLSLSLNLLLDTIQGISLPSPVFSRWALHVCPPSRYQGSWSFCLCTDILYQPIPERDQSSGTTSPLYRTVPPSL